MTTTIAQLETLVNEIEACVRDELARHTDRELDELIVGHLHDCAAVVTAALIACPSKLTTMAAVTLYREKLRRAQVQALEASHAT